MKLGLLGYPVEHSLSPKLYREYLKSELVSYELFSFKEAKDIPSLDFFKQRLDGLNITSPYKNHFINQITIPSPLVKKIGAVNTLVFYDDVTLGTNTDVIAVHKILSRFKEKFPVLNLLLLGSGVMANLTEIVAAELDLPLKKFSRKNSSDLSHLDLSLFQQRGAQSLIINACSREFIFQGKLSGQEIFWDYNYSFLPHKNTLPSRVLSYQDGQEMLKLQAIAAIEFWKQYKT